MAEVRLDELVTWQEDGRGGVTGFTGERGEHRLGMVGRFLLPRLGPDFAEPGDLLQIKREAFFTSNVSGLANLTQRRVEFADPARVALLAILILLLPMPSVVTAGRWWLLIVSGVAAALPLYMLLDSRIALRDAVTEEKAAGTLTRWRWLRPHLLPNAPPRPTITVREGPEPDWVELLGQAYAGTLPHHDTVHVADLPVPDGKLLACEPFQIHDPRPYTVPVPPGTYQAFISVAASSDGQDQRIAYAWVRLRDGMPARWEPACTRAGEEVSVGVDSGIAGFVSAASAAKIVEAYRQPECDYGEPLSDAIVTGMDKVWRDTRGWTAIDAGEYARFAAFSSGFGDGVYPVYRALDARGRRLAVAIVFYVDW